MAMDFNFTDCTTINHFRWHSAYLALDMHPDWPNVAPAETRGEFYRDAALALLLLASNMPAMFAYPSYMAETLMLLLACMAFSA